MIPVQTENDFYSLASDREPVFFFINGDFAQNLSRNTDLPEGLSVSPGAEIIIDIKPKTILPTPLHLIFGGSAIALRDCSSAKKMPHVTVRAGAESKTTLVTLYSGSNETPYSTDNTSEIWLETSACLDHYTIQKEGAGAAFKKTLKIHLGDKSHYTSNVVILGGETSSLQMNALLEAPGGHCTFNGLYVGQNKQKLDHEIVIDHLKPDGTSRTFYKGILDGHSRGAFNGRVIVHRDAQKSDSQQVNKNLLLSRNAEADPRPELEIYADDVKCTHGATVGQLDENALFYLRSRGLNEIPARNMLIHAFANDVLEQMPNKKIRAQLECWLMTHLPG